MGSKILPGDGLQGDWNMGDEWGGGANDNWLRISALSNLIVESATASIPDPCPEGAMYIVPSGGDAGKIAVQHNELRLFSVRAGRTAWVKDTGKRLRFNGTTWIDDLSKSSVGLSNVDNTSDTSKPISAATQAALNLKAPIASPSFIGVATVAQGLKITTTSADSNVLDYYEEGLFTPAFVGSTTAGSVTYSSRYGSYTRVGDRVFFTLRMVVSSKGGAAGSVWISGMPFAAYNDVGERGSALVRVSNLAATTGTIAARFGQNTATIVLLKLGASGAEQNLAVSDVADSSPEITISGQYRV